MPGRIGETVPLKPGNMAFPVLFLFFYPSFPKIRQCHPNKTYFFEINKSRAIMSQTCNLLSVKLWLRQVFENGSNYAKQYQKHLNNIMVSMKTKQKIFSSLYIS